MFLIHGNDLSLWPVLTLKKYRPEGQSALHNFFYWSCSRPRNAQFLFVIGRVSSPSIQLNTWVAGWLLCLFFACFVRLGGIIFEEVPSRGQSVFWNLIEVVRLTGTAQLLFVIGLCLALPSIKFNTWVAGWLLWLFSITCFVLPCDIIFKEVLSRGSVCFETLLKLFELPNFPAFVCNWPLYCPLQFQWNKALFDDWLWQDLMYTPV